MSDNPLSDLLNLRAALVEKRRTMAAAGDGIADVQREIEAVDHALADERAIRQGEAERAKMEEAEAKARAGIGD
jgi:translation initiation factor 2B subunit (eIF-2B alpha/beta/delta family)